MKLLIDGDILVYRAAFAVQSGDEVEPPGHARRCVDMLLNSILYAIPHVDYTLYLTSENGSNFRNHVAVTRPYKGNRTQAKPIHYDVVRKHLCRLSQTKMVYNMEADDALGINQAVNTCIVTLDKDLNMIPGKHYNFVTQEFTDISRTEAYRNFCIQLLVGDSVDNISGCPKIGEVKAKRAISHAGRDKDKMLKIVYDLYDDEELFLEMGKLVWIWREEDGIFTPDLEHLRTTKKVLYSTKVSKSESVPCKMGETIDDAIRRSKHGQPKG